MALNLYDIFLKQYTAKVYYFVAASPLLFLYPIKTIRSMLAASRTMYLIALLPSKVLGIELLFVFICSLVYILDCALIEVWLAGAL